ncbi:MAG: HAMP domain-containing histidine kinase, partial [Anaerolineaceae bacterium]|nr:HAMP domain-containing histidine kinase [Anaerolineaceae bacterium]
LFQHIEGKTVLPEIVRINTRLVVRESFGCGTRGTNLNRSEISNFSLLSMADILHAQSVGKITEVVMNQAQNLEEKDCQVFCERLINSFVLSVAHNDRREFLGTLDEILQYSVTGGDDAHIWQVAVSLIGKDYNALDETNPASISLVKDMLDQARLAISAYMQQQHRQYVSSQRWVTSRLSLLTADLLNALDENQIFAILAQHLPVMDIRLALIVLLEGDSTDPVAWSTARNALAPAQDEVRFSSFTFPLGCRFHMDQPYHLVLIPLVGQTGQLGYVIFGTEYIDLYGAIVQQLSGALNTARLYRQATEGRHLAEEANRMKSRFLSTISHELRTPLNLIVGLTGIVLQANDEGEVPLPESTQKDIERIHTYSQHLGGLIGDVLDLATSDAGQLRLDYDFIELGQVLSIVAESGRQLAADKGLSWKAILPEMGAWVWGDRTRLRQVALNLINNAIKFTERGEVSLRLETGADSVNVQVSDTGLGISPDEQQVIFDEFRQSERSVALGYGGLGLGLAISKRLVEMHGGTIAVRSSGKEGSGSTFSFSLPKAQAPVDRIRRQTVQPQKEQTVMVLTNQPASCERLCVQLQERGYQLQIIPVDSPVGWQSQLFEILPEVVLLDVSIASNLGWDVLKAIKGSQMANEIPVLFFKT